MARQGSNKDLGVIIAMDTKFDPILLIFADVKAMIKANNQTKIFPPHTKQEVVTKLNKALSFLKKIQSDINAWNTVGKVSWAEYEAYGKNRAKFIRQYGKLKKDASTMNCGVLSWLQQLFQSIDKVLGVALPTIKAISKGVKLLSGPS